MTDMLIEIPPTMRDHHDSADNPRLFRKLTYHGGHVVEIGVAVPDKQNVQRIAVFHDTFLPIKVYFARIGVPNSPHILPIRFPIQRGSANLRRDSRFPSHTGLLRNDFKERMNCASHFRAGCLFRGTNAVVVHRNQRIGSCPLHGDRCIR